MRLSSRCCGFVTGVVLSFSAVCCAAQAAPGTDIFAQSPNALLAAYQNWIDQDVHWIISEEERTEFLGLTTNDGRDRFVVEFWNRHDPSPNTPRNEFKEEHYRRLAYSNEHFAEATPGWSTDRGRIYVLYGPPDESRTETILGKVTQIWRYRHIVGSGADVEFRFVDECECGAYRQVQPTRL